MNSVLTLAATLILSMTLLAMGRTAGYLAIARVGKRVATQVKMTWPLRADATVQRSYFMHGRTALSFTRIEPQE
jgi:hypothetical protein